MYARRRLTRWNNRFARTYAAGAVFAACDATLFDHTITPQVVRDTWQDDRNRVAAMLDSLSEPAYNRLVVDYWRQYGRPNGVTLVDIHLAFFLVRFWPVADMAKSVAA